ncbi:MAG: pyrimidine 5'-nucleotidase [Alphaproteobacteria bacterium]|nr:pyrimidine 5'-nucleotidase [Alphaproteobacteria bacterium]
MPLPKLSNVNVWIFDLDNTLYPPEARLFDQIQTLMTQYVMRELDVAVATANQLRDQYWRHYGTTLSGLMHEHDIDPAPYLREIHDISLANLTQDRALSQAIRKLPGRKIVYTNGPKFHAERVTQARGLGGIFDVIYGIEHADYRPKPERAAFEQILKQDGSDPNLAAMFEDDARNLSAPHEMGMACVLVGPKPASTLAHIHHQTEDLTDFLTNVLTPGLSRRAEAD